MDYQEYKHDFLESLRNDSAISGSETEEEFLNRALGILTDFNEIEDPMCVGMGDKSRKNKSLMRIDGYSFDEVDRSLIVDEYKKSDYFKLITVKDLLRIDYDNKKLLDEAIECTPNDTVSRREIWDENPKIVLENGSINPDIQVIRTITTKQDRNPNSGNLYFDCKINGRSKFRYLTPRECFLFMGFTDEDYENVIENNPEVHKNSKLFPRDKLIRMAGNSIPVKLLEGIFLQIKKLDETLDY